MPTETVGICRRRIRATPVLRRLPAFNGTPGKPIDYVLGVQRYAATIHLVTEHHHYLGTIINDQFVADDNYDDGETWQCGAAKLRFRTEARVSGRVSADGNVLTAEKVAVFLLESGETIRRQWG
jgi:hypothetical protein